MFFFFSPRCFTRKMLPAIALLAETAPRSLLSSCVGVCIIWGVVLLYWCGALVVGTCVYGINCWKNIITRSWCDFTVWAAPQFKWTHQLSMQYAKLQTGDSGCYSARKWLLPEMCSRCIFSNICDMCPTSDFNIWLILHTIFSQHLRSDNFPTMFPNCSRDFSKNFSITFPNGWVGVGG